MFVVPDESFEAWSTWAPPLTLTLDCLMDDTDSDRDLAPPIKVFDFRNGVEKATPGTISYFPLCLLFVDFA